MPEHPALPRPSEPILVRVSPEILERMKAGDVEPVVILGVQEASDGAYDMTLQTPDVVAENRRLRRALENIANWKEFQDRQPEPMRIGQYARGVLDG